jgi:O-antigen/teichoic acid export membrane protein
MSNLFNSKAMPIGALIKSLFNTIKSNSFVRKAAVLSSGSAAGHIFTLAVSPFLTRMYRPEDFGSLGLFTSFLSVAGVAVAFQYEVSIISTPNQSDAAYIALGAVLLGIPTSVIAGLALWALIHYSLLGFGGLPWYAPAALACVMCFVGYFATLRYLNLRNQNFRDVSEATFTQNAARAIFQATAGVFGLHDAGLILGETLGRGVGMGRMLRSTWPGLRDYIGNFHWCDCKQALWKHRKFPLLTFPSALIDAISTSLAVPLIIQLYGPKNGGYYALVWRVLSLPSILITLAVADTFHSEIAELVRKTPNAAFSFFFKTSKTLALVGVIPCAILMLCARQLFALALGPQWGVSGAMAAIIAPWYMGQFVVNPISRLVLVLSGQETKLVWDVLCLISIPAVFYVAQVEKLDVLAAVRLLSAVNTILYAAYFVVLLRLVLAFNRSIKVSSILNISAENASQ